MPPQASPVPASTAYSPRGGGPEAHTVARRRRAPEPPEMRPCPPPLRCSPLPLPPPPPPLLASFLALPLLLLVLAPVDSAAQPPRAANPARSQTIASLLVAGSSASGTADICERLKTYLVKRQRKICRRHPRLISSLFYGYGMAWRECKRQFMHSRWDCDGNLDRNVFELLHNKGTREAAYLLAVTSAGVAHAVTKACSSGKHVHCGCDRTVYDHPSDKNHRWSGCSDNIFFGAAFTKRFIDSYERRTRKRNPALAFTKLHNNRVGRETVMQMMKVMCKCHGVSGSCELKTCWRSLPNFAEVGRTLRSKFDSAVQVDLRNKRLINRESMEAVPQHLLAYMRPSPDFCYADTEAGSVGTRGRECNKTLSAANNCNQLCCRRGFSTRIVVRAVQCNCKFVWCCSVRCDECRMPVEVSKCL